VESKVKFLGHSVHQILIVFPLGLLATAGVFDVLHLVTRAGKWAQTSFYMMGAGIIGGLASAVFGLLDWLGIPAGTRAKEVGLWHGAGNLILMMLYTVSWLKRKENPRKPERAAFVFSFLGLGIAAFTGWLGGELVDRLGVGVHEGAHLNAPNSLSGLPAYIDAKDPDYATDDDTLDLAFVEEEV